MYRRNITDKLNAALEDTPVVLINGARQTGKSTVAQTLVAKRNHTEYLNLDEISILAAAQNDPAAFIKRYDGNIILDEIQRAPELFLPIKATVDKNRQPGRFLLTGSANVLLLPQIADSLAGRIEILTLWPLSQGEINNTQERFIDLAFENKLPITYKSKLKLPALLNKILYGGYPEILTRATEERRHAWFNSYITTIIQRDIRDLAEIEKLTDLPRLLKLLATRAATLLNFSELSRTSTIPQTSLKRYVSLLQMIFLVHMLPPWSHHRGKRLVKTPKVFLNDTGLLCDLMGFNESYLLNDMNQTGHVLENFVVNELLKQITWSKLEPQIYHFRTQAGQEVDIVLEDRSGNIVGIEIKSNSSIQPKDFNGLEALAEISGKKFVQGILLYLGQDCIPYGKNMTAMPVDSLWEV